MRSIAPKSGDHILSRYVVASLLWKQKLGSIASGSGLRPITLRRASLAAVDVRVATHRCPFPRRALVLTPLGDGAHEIEGEHTDLHPVTSFNADRTAVA